jgi:hypothetical protein
MSYVPKEGDEVVVALRGTILWVGDKHFEVDEWVLDLAHLRHPGFKIQRVD